MDNNLKLNTLEMQLKEELQLLGFPPSNWLPPSDILDVAIIGAGMAGICASFALMRQGIFHQQVFDVAKEGFEGPWNTYARMKTLRSTKELVGPALDIPKLTFQAWYSAKFGEKEWEALYKIPTQIWMTYLGWFRGVLNLPVTNQSDILLVAPLDDALTLHFKNGQIIKTRKIVLANGRGGFGGNYIPPIIKSLSKAYYAHTSEMIDFNLLKSKRILIIGAGASAFDAAATALECGATSATMLTRRSKIPFVNKAASLGYPGFSYGYHLLPDSYKISMMEELEFAGAPPPFESLDRVENFPNFGLLQGFKIDEIVMLNNTIKVVSKQKTVVADFVISATGFTTDGSNEPLLKNLLKDILLWGDRHLHLNSKIASAPYLGPHFQFLEKLPGCAPFLKNIYCFNAAATISHGLNSSDIPQISIGAERLSKGIAADFFTQNAAIYLEKLLHYDVKEFDLSNYAFTD